MVFFKNILGSFWTYSFNSKKFFSGYVAKISSKGIYQCSGSSSSASSAACTSSFAECAGSKHVPSPSTRQRSRVAAGPWGPVVRRPAAETLASHAGRSARAGRI